MVVDEELDTDVEVVGVVWGAQPASSMQKTMAIQGVRMICIKS
jgi:hypothetical protein